MQRIFFTLATACIASIASAADLPVKAPVPAPAPVYSWTGFYIGGHVGALWTRASGRTDPLPNVPFFGVFPNAGDLNETAFVGRCTRRIQLATVALVGRGYRSGLVVD